MWTRRELTSGRLHFMLHRKKVIIRCSTKCHGTERTEQCLYGLCLGQIDCVRLLLAAGADVHKCRTDLRISPLYTAAEMGHAPCVQALVDARSDINNALATDGRTCLYVAAANGHTNTVRALLKAGADLNKARTDTGATPLAAALASKAPSRGECVLQLKRAAMET